MTDNYIDRAGGRALDLMRSLFGEASPNTVFSEPSQVGADVVVTAAAWERIGGFGFGGGGDENDNGGAGAGGGGVSQGRPVAVIRLSPDETEVIAVPDVTKIAVTLILSALGVWRALKT